MNEDELKAEVYSWLAESRMRHVRDYASRGRSLKKASKHQLNSEWIALVQDWAANPQEHNNSRNGAAGGATGGDL